MLTPPHRYLLWISLLLIALVIVSGVAFLVAPPADRHETSVVRVPSLLARERTIAGIGDKQFAALISYTDRGFEPREATIKKGAIVRFVNNSTRTMRIAASAQPPYANDAKRCAGGRLDACNELSPGEYLEYAFTAAGDWSFHENTRVDARGVIHVR